MCSAIARLLYLTSGATGRSSCRVGEGLAGAALFRRLLRDDVAGTSYPHLDAMAPLFHDLDYEK